MRKENIIIGIVAFFLAVGIAARAISETGKYEIVCNTNKENPTIRHSVESDAASDARVFRIWYAVGLKTFRASQFIMSNGGQQLLKGHVFDFRGRQTYLENKQTGSVKKEFYVLASEWDCNLNDYSKE